jgi:4-hydroxythreonine-4-phosphate dehydrogenase
MTMPDSRPLIGLMLGDVTGIGPEVAAKLLSEPATARRARVVVVGDARVLSLGQQEAGVSLAWRRVESVAGIDWSQPGLPLIDLGNIDPAALPRGVTSAESGRLTAETLQRMTRMALEGEIEGVCFAPLNKGAIHQGGFGFNDEHEMFAHWNGHRGYYGEVNLISLFSTFRVTSHVSLRRAVDLVQPDRIRGALTLAHDTLRAFGIAQPRIGVAALNPHGGEGGLFGDEEIRIIGPALEQLRAEGLAAQGPFPSDTVFLKAQRGDLDAVIIMYHDQGQIATKLLGFSEGVTITGGLRTVYTTPAHGTAYDIVGQGRADPGAMRRAFEAACSLALARRTTPDVNVSENRPRAVGAKP